MRDFALPRDTQPSVVNALRQIQLRLENLGVPLLKDRKSLLGLAEGTSAYFIDGATLYRYTKIGGELFKEPVDVGVDTAEVREIAEEEVANAPRATLTGTTEKSVGAVGELRQQLVFYDVGNPPPERFLYNVYLTKADLIDESPVPESEKAIYISDAVFDPATPNPESGTHFTTFSYRTVRQGNVFLLFSTE